MAAINATQPEIPEGYIRLPYDAIKKPGDLIWKQERGLWCKTALPGMHVGAGVLVIRKVKKEEKPKRELPEGFGSW